MCGAPLAWDGGYYLFKLLDTQQAFLPHERAINHLLQAPPLWLSQVTSDLALLRFAFSLTYVLVGPLCLLVAWLLLRPDHERAAVWPALGVLLAVLPGQMLFVGESVVASQLFWPLLAALVQPVSWRSLALAGVLAGAVYLAHPTAVALLGFAAAYAAWRGLREPAWRLPRLALAAVLLALGLLRVLAQRTTYEAESLSVDRLVDSFRVAVVGWPLASLILTALAAAALLAAPLVAGATGGRARALRFAPAVLALGAGVALLPWARNVTVWAHALDFRFWDAPLTLALAVGMLLDVHVAGRGRGLGLSADAQRRWMLRAAAVSYAVVLSLQSIVWARAVGRLMDEVRARPESCIPLRSLGAIAGTPMDHWATAPLAIVLQARQPDRLVLDGESCAQFQRDGTAVIADWDVRPPGSGWFRLQP